MTHSIAPLTLPLCHGCMGPLLADGVSRGAAPIQFTGAGLGARQLSLGAAGDCPLGRVKPHLAVLRKHSYRGQPGFPGPCGAIQFPAKEGRS